MKAEGRRWNSKTRITAATFFLRAPIFFWLGFWRKRH
jgi:hypothetical protein